MNVGISSGVVGSAAGAPLSQSSSAETERASKDAAARERTVNSQELSEKASGIGQTQEDGESSERDADGRRPWEIAAKRKAAAEAPAAAPRKAKDPSGVSGNELDLTG